MANNRDWAIEVAADGARDSVIVAPFDRQPLGHAAMRTLVPAFKKGGNGGFALAFTLAARPCGVTLPRIASAIDALGGKQYGAAGARSWLNASTLGHDVGLGVISHYAPIGEYLAQCESYASALNLAGETKRTSEEVAEFVDAERACLLESQRKAGDSLTVLVVRALLLDSDKAEWPAIGKGESKRVYRMRLTHELADRQVYACDASKALAPCDASNGKPIVYVQSAPPSTNASDSAANKKARAAQKRKAARTSGGSK